MRAKLEHFLTLYVGFVEQWLLQHRHEDVQRLLGFSAETFYNITKEIRLVDNLNIRTCILQTARNAGRIELLCTAQSRAKHELGDARVFFGFVETSAGIKNAEGHQWQTMVLHNVDIRTAQDRPLLNRPQQVHHHTAID